MDWKEYRRPLLKPGWYPANPPYKGFDDKALRAAIRNFGSEVTKCTIKDYSIYEERAQAQKKPSIIISQHDERISEFYSSQFDYQYRWGLSLVKKAKVLLPFGIIWSDDDNNIIEESLAHSNLRCSWFFHQSFITDWKILKSSWFPEPIKIKCPTFWTYEPQYTNYFHYINDNLVKLEKLIQWSTEGIGLVGKGFSFFSAPITHDTFVHRLLNGSPVRDNHKHYPHGYYEFDELLVPYYYADYPISHNLSDTYRARAFDGGIYKRLRDRHVKIDAGRSNKLMLLREDAKHRNISNHKEVSDFLTSYRFSSYSPGHADIMDQARIFNSSSLLAGVHGASLTNLMWCEPGSTVLELIPYDHQDLGYSGISNANQLNHMVIFCDSDGVEQNMKKPAAYRDIVVNLSDLSRAIQSV